MRTFSWLFCGVFVAGLGSPALAQKAHARSTTVSRPPRPAAIDTTIQVVPAAVRAATLAQVFAYLDHRARSEFEATDAYRARLAPLTDSARFFAVQVPMEGNACAPKIRYDADRQRWMLTTGQMASQVSPGLVDRKRESDVTFDGIWVSCTETDLGTATGRNVYGTHAGIRRARVTKWLVRAPENLVGPSNQDIDLEIAMSASEAQALKGRLRLLVVFSPSIEVETDYLRSNVVTGELVYNTQTITVSASYSHDATWDDRVERSFRLHGVWSQRIGLWVIDRLTGKVFGKWWLPIR